MLNCLVEKVCLAPNALCLCCGSVSIFWSCVVYDFVPALWLCTFFFFYVHPGGDVGLLLAYTDFQKHTGCTAVVWKAAVYSGYLQCIRNVSAMYPQCIQPRIGRTNQYCYLPVRAKGYGAEMNRRKWNFITFHWNFSIFVYRCTGIIGGITDSINMGRKYTEFSVYIFKKKNCFFCSIFSRYQQYIQSVFRPVLRYYCFKFISIHLSLLQARGKTNPPSPQHNAILLFQIYLHPGR